MFAPILAALAAFQVSLPAMPPAQPKPPRVGIPKPVGEPRDVSKSPHLTPPTSK